MSEEELKEFNECRFSPESFIAPFFTEESCKSKSGATIWFVNICRLFFQGKHCLLDITPEEVERLNFSQLYPIVIFLRPPNKQMVK